jgi:hypothetical protein
MENPTDQPLKILKEQLTEYIELKSEQARLGLIENSAKVTAYFSSAIIIIALVMFCLLSLLVAISFFLGQSLHNYGLGFLISAGIYLFLLIIFLLVIRKKSEGSIINKVIKLTNEDGNN